MERVLGLTISYEHGRNVIQQKGKLIPTATYDSLKHRRTA